jgi:capsular exopolysaccharide synthesis family protein
MVRMNAPGQAIQGVPATFETRVPPPANDRIDLRLMTAIFRRRIGVFLAVLLAVLAAGAVLTALQTPSYIATSEITLNSKIQPIAPVGTTDRLEPASIPNETYVDTQVAIVTSEANIAAVVDGLGLVRQPRFTTGATPAEARADAMEYVRSGVSARRLGTTYGTGIAFESTDPDEAARIANAFAEQFTTGALGEKRDDARKSNALLSDRLNQLRDRALLDTAAVQRYRIANNLLTTTGSSLTEQEISAYNQQVTAARAQSVEDVARLDSARRQLRSGSVGDDVGASLGSPVIATLRTQQATVAGEVASLTARYGTRHPDVIKAQAQLSSINGQIAAEITRVISGLEAKVHVSQDRLASLSGSLNQSRSALAGNNAAMVGLQDLEKRAETSNALYQSYLNRYKEMAAREGTEQADADILHRAEVPGRASSPNIILNGVLALALGVGLGTAGAFLAELTFSGLTTGDDIEQRLGVRYLGSIPALDSVSKGSGNKPMTAILEDPKSAFAESFRSLRASIAMNTTRAQVIAITSSLPEEGKTTTAICLARSMALSGDSVLLVDCDLRRQGVSRFLRGDGDRPGLMEVLRGTATLDQALVVDPATNLNILPLASEGDDAPELLTGDEMDRLLEQVRERFHATIIDTAPVLPIADARLVLGKADASVFVVRWRKTPEAALRSALRLLPTDRVELAGVALTRVDMRKQAKFGYGDDSFYNSYKSYYA